MDSKRKRRQELHKSPEASAPRGSGVEVPAPTEIMGARGLPMPGIFLSPSPSQARKIAISRIKLHQAKLKASEESGFGSKGRVEVHMAGTNT